MGYMKYLKKTLGNKESKDLMKKRKIDWRKGPATVRVKNPTNILRARSLGYKAKQGILVVRQRIKRGGRMTEKPAGGRRSKRSGRNKVLDKSYQVVAEERVSRKYPNCEVLNSYEVTQDGQYTWYEVILVDKVHPRTLFDKDKVFMLFHKGRAFRGLTSAGKKSRGYRARGLGSEDKK